jgi:hypothetical protein
MKIGIISCVIALLFFVHSIGGSITEVDEQSYPFIFIEGSVAYSDLSSAGTLIVYEAIEESSRYRILSIATSSAGSTNFAIGNRDISIGTTSETKWVIPATSLATVESIGLLSSSNGITGINPSTTSTSISETAAGEDIVMKYSGGTTDYTTAGEVVFTVMLIQTVE